MNIGFKIKSIRKSKSITQTQLGNLIGKTLRTIQKYESGEVIPPLEVLQKISKVLNVSVFELYDDDLLAKWESNTDAIKQELNEYKITDSLLDLCGYKVNHLLISSEEEIPLEDYTLDITNLKSGEVKTLNVLEYKQFIERLKHFIDFEFFCIKK